MVVVAQPHDCNIGQNGGCDNLVQFGHEYTREDRSRPINRCLSSIVQHSLLVLDGYLIGEPNRKLFEYELLYICKVVVYHLSQ